MPSVKLNKTTLPKLKERVSRSVSVFLDDVNAHTARAVQLGGEELLRVSRELAPLDTGALRASGRVSVGTAIAGRKQARVKAVVEFGGEFNVSTSMMVALGGTGSRKNLVGGKVTYAGAVHEGLHPSGVSPTYRVGGPKFLEIGGARARPKVSEIIRKELKKVASGRK